MDSDFRGRAIVQPMMKKFLNFLIWIRIYTLSYPPPTIKFTLCYDEKIFELFYLVLYIHIVMFFVLKSIMKIVKAFCLVLYYVYIVFFSYGVFLSFSLSALLYSIIHTHAFLLFLFLPDFERYRCSLSFSYCRNISNSFIAV